MRIRACLPVLACLAAASPAYAGAPGVRDPLAQAADLWSAYVDRARAFDPAIAGLYCDQASIRNVRRQPDGQVRALSLSMAQYAPLLRAAMPLAKARGDVNDYSAPSYHTERGRVRIAVQRSSRLKRYTSPLTLLVGACTPGGRWGVLEEAGESRP